MQTIVENLCSEMKKNHEEDHEEKWEVYETHDTTKLKSAYRDPHHIVSSIRTYGQSVHFGC